MRVLLLTNDFPNSLQPTRGIFNYEMASALAHQHDVAVLAQVSWLDEWKWRVQGKHLERRRTIGRLRVWHPRYYYPPTLLRAHYGSFLWWSVASVARRRISEFRPDVVLAYWLHPDGDAAVRIAREARLPVVVMSGGSDVLMLARNRGRRRHILKVLQQADAVICVSGHLKSAVEALGIAHRKIHVVYRGVDRETFCPADRHEARARLGLDASRTVLLWVGRMVPVKGVGTLLDACGSLKRTGLDFVLCLVGDGPLRTALARQAAHAGLADCVRFVGRVNHDELPDWYRASDLTVLPSLSEGIPNVLLEAMACGSSFVATDVGGVSEIADSRIDRLVPPGDADALATAITELLGRGDSGERRVPPSTWAESSERLADVCQACIQAPDVTGVGRTLAVEAS